MHACDEEVRRQVAYWWIIKRTPKLNLICPSQATHIFLIMRPDGSSCAKIEWLHRPATTTALPTVATHCACAIQLSEILMIFGGRFRRRIQETGVSYNYLVSLPGLRWEGVVKGMHAFKQRNSHLTMGEEANYRLKHRRNYTVKPPKRRRDRETWGLLWWQRSAQNWSSANRGNPICFYKERWVCKSIATRKVGIYGYSCGFLKVNRG